MAHCGFQNYIDLVLCIIGSHQKNIKLYALDTLLFQWANKLSKPVNIQSGSPKKNIC